jgi:hypothetical protein
MNTYAHPVDDFLPWHATVPGIREAVLDFLVTQAFPEAGPPQHMPTQHEVEVTCEMAVEAVQAGRVFDLGRLDNDLLMDCGNRGAKMFYAGALPQPFRDPWLFVHTWGGLRPGEDLNETAAYLVNPVGDDCEVVELQPASIGGRRLLTIGDRALLFGPDPGMPFDAKYNCSVAPSAWRYERGMEVINNGGSPENAAAGNVLDPLMAALMLLNTNGLDRRVVAASDKLNRARRRSGKPTIPPYTTIDSGPYVTALRARHGGPRQAAGDGHHASPVPHIRRGHFRHYADGARSFIRDTLVNVLPEARADFLAKRSHYQVG